MSIAQVFASPFEPPLNFLSDDEDCVRSAIKQNPNHLVHASERLRDNPDIVLSAISKSGNALEYASERLRDNPDIVLSAINVLPDAIQHASDRIKNTDDIVSAAVMKDGLTIRHASNRIKDNLYMCIVALTQNKKAFQYLSKEMQKTHEIALTAKQHNKYPEEISDQLAKKVVKLNGWFFLELPKRFHSNVEIIQIAIKTYPEVIDLPQVIKCASTFPPEKTKKLLLDALKTNGLLLRSPFAQPYLKDEEILLAAYKQNPKALAILDPLERAIFLKTARNNPISKERTVPSIKKLLKFIGLQNKKMQFKPVQYAILKNEKGTVSQPAKIIKQIKQLMLTNKFYDLSPSF